MSEWTEYFLNSSRNVIQYETLEISHPSFSQVFRIVRNAVNGIAAKIETGETVNYIYRPIALTQLGSRQDLDSGVRVALGDLGEVMPKELDAVAAADTFRINPVVKYRAYRSDNLNSVMVGPLILEVSNFSFNRQGTSFDATAPRLNINRTGEIFTFERFPMLRGLL